MTYQSLWDTGKAVLRGKFIAKQTYFKKKTNKKISNKQSNFTPEELEEEKMKPKINRRKKIIKTRAKNK